MLQFKLLKAEALKRMVETISSIYPIASIYFLRNIIYFKVYNYKADIFGSLEIDTTSDFFHQYYLARPFTIKCNLRQLNSILSSADDDDHLQVSISISAVHEAANNFVLLDFLISNPINNKNQRETMEALIKHQNNRPVEPLHQFQVGINPFHLGYILQHSTHNQEPIDITITSTMVILASGTETISLFKQNVWDCILENLPQNMYYKLQLSLHNHAECFTLACRNADVVYLKDSLVSATSNLQPVLEFQLGLFSKLRFYLLKPYL